MIWNQVGIVKSFASEDENSIDVKFHDTAVHHPIHLGNSAGYTMADLSEEALVLASEASGDDIDGGSEEAATNSKLMCHYFGSSGLVTTPLFSFLIQPTFQQAPNQGLCQLI